LDLECTLAYFYGNSSEPGAEPKLNEAVDLIGILSFDPVLLAAACPPMDKGIGRGLPDEEGEEDAASLCPSRVPRLHVLAWCRADRLLTPNLASAFTNLDFSKHLPSPMVPPPAGLDSPAAVEHAREATLSLLSTALGGDRMAGEYLLLGLISRVVARTTASVVGHLPLNFTAPHMGDLLPTLKACIEDLVPRCQAVKVDIAGLEAKRWFPYKDYNTNRLVSAPLQVGGKGLMGPKGIQGRVRAYLVLFV
jgi:hypothetical protein